MFPVIFVSLGPGEPELITVKGLKTLQTADCIFCPETLAKDGNRGRAPCSQPGRAADGDTRYRHHRRDRKTDKRKQCGCHHEAVQMHR